MKNVPSSGFFSVVVHHSTSFIDGTAMVVVLNTEMYLNLLFEKNYAANTNQFNLKNDFVVGLSCTVT